MQCKVLSASLGRDGKVYKQGEYIEIGPDKEAEELSSFGCVLIEAVKKVEKVKDVKEVEEVGKVKPSQSKQYGGKKKK
jgi:hypothetical protein